MAGTFIKFDTREIDHLVRRLNQGAALKSSDRVQLLKNLGAEIEDQTRERFSTKKTPDGTPWKDISETTREYYAENFPGAQPSLVLTGGLRDSVETQTQNQWAIIVGATKEYAPVHQWGADQGAFGTTKRGLPIPFGDVPSRPYLGIGPQDEQALAGIVTEFIAGLLSRSA